MDIHQNLSIKIGEIKKTLQADVIHGNDRLDTRVGKIYASDLMSEVLAYGKPESALLTGLCTKQATMSAYMADFKAIIFLRGKKPDDDNRALAAEKGLIVLSTNIDMFEACVKVASLFSDSAPFREEVVSADLVKNITIHEFSIDGRDFANSGAVSTGIKTILMSIGYDPQLIRRIAISSYEGEMNVVMHARKADVTLTASDEEIVVLIDDEGKGIPDVERAMEVGYSTATEDQRAMGFGAGMGLPNIKKNTDDLKISSEVGRGTKTEMRFFVK